MTSQNEIEKLYEEHSALVDKMFEKGLKKREEERLKEIREQLDRIETEQLNRIETDLDTACNTYQCKNSNS